MEKKFKAFTLAEMLIVLFIAAIILTMSAPMITKKAKKAPNTTQGAGIQVPIGSIMIWGGAAAVPHGWLECDGKPIKDPRYAKLRNALGGDKLPDMRGMFLTGVAEDNEKDSNTDEANLERYAQTNPEIAVLLETLKKTRKNSNKVVYPKFIPVTWIIKAEQ